jgi:polyvinyl alcohol dehydrogenase (cytochrome)
MRFLALLFAATLLPMTPVRADTPATVPDARVHGAKIYEANCAVCHDRAEGRTPSRAYLRQSRSPDYILRALTTGIMRQNAAALSLEEKKAVATYLIGRPPGLEAEIDPNANRCTAPGPTTTITGSSWNGWAGQGVTNARYQPDPGFTAAELPRLRLKWAFAYPGGVSNEPAVVGGRIFVGSMSGTLFSLDARTGCTYWNVQLGAPVRAMVTVGRLASGKLAVYAADWRGQVYAFDADTGAELWRARVDEHPAVRLTGTPTLFEGRLYVPVSSGEEALAPDPKYTCCTFRGSLVAVDAENGRVIWKSYTIDQPPGPVPGNKHQQGPSGAAIWSSPTIDAKRRLVYVTTGDDYSEPASNASDAVIAYDLATGKKRWSTQVLKGDVFVGGCGPKRHVNCPQGEIGPDFDFGASPLLVRTGDGKERIVAMTKGSVAYAFDPDDNGKLLWQTQIGRGGLLGGVEWGAATDGVNVYAPVSDADYGSEIVKSNLPQKPGLNALDAAGKLLWHVPAPKASCSWKGQCINAHAGAVALMPGVVFAGSWDGHERAFSSVDGKLLWEFDTGITFDAVNGGKASGGSIDHGAQSIAAGMLLVNSGGRQGQPGNALLVFTVDGK